MGDSSETLQPPQGSSETLNKTEDENNCQLQPENTTNVEGESENDLSAGDKLLMSESDAEVSPQKKPRKSHDSSKTETSINNSSDVAPHDNNNTGIIDPVIAAGEDEVFNNAESDKETNADMHRRMKNLCDSESESESESEDKQNNDNTSQKIGKENSSLVDSESEEDNSECKPSETVTHSNERHAVIKDLTTIKSESQRLTREHEIRVPYHKPKQFTLKEFLTRKTISKPTILKPVNLKMSQEELEDYAKHLEEREKEASEFFKSDVQNEAMEIGGCEESFIKNDPQSSPDKEDPDEAKDGEKGSQELQLDQPTARNDTHVSEDGPPTLPPTDGTSNTQKSRRLLPNFESHFKPCLQGDPNMIIDLETGELISRSQTGVENLLQRFIKSSTTGGRTKRSENLRENTNSEIIGVVSVKEESTENFENKPGAAYLQFKNNLKKIIIDKRKNELIKKVRENEDDAPKQLDDSEEKDVDEKDPEDESTDAIEEDYAEIDENEEIEDNEGLLFNEADESEADDELDTDESDRDDEDHDDCEDNSIDQLPKKRSRVIAPFDDSDEETDKVTKEIDDIWKEPASENNSSKLLWVDAESESDDNGELLDLCSGNFDSTQQTQKGITQSCLSSVEEAEEQNAGIATAADSPKDDEDMEFSARKFSKKSPRTAGFRKRRKLGFSDDEDESDSDIKEDQIDENTNGSDSLEAQEPEPIETYIDYDSEENEIEVKPAASDRNDAENMADFFENEAELSESEWGSADEDEKGLDRYDFELGDEEQYDKGKLQTELGQIHLRKMLDEDMREVKKIQELLFEDEENDGVGRERRFRWKKDETDFNVDKPLADDNVENPKTDDEENEEDWRKMRYEREVFLKEKPQKANAELLPLAVSPESKPLWRAGFREISDVDAVNVVENSPNLSILISKKATSARGSFLIRDKGTLSKLASITKAGVDSDFVAVAGANSSGKGRNFIFTAISESEQLTCKRKFPDSATSCASNKLKKQKVIEDTDTKTRLINHLL